MSAFDNAWNTILSGSADGREEKRRLIELFPQNNEMLDDRQFTRLHKIVLRLIQRELDVELDESTALINTKDSFGKRRCGGQPGDLILMLFVRSSTMALIFGRLRVRASNQFTPLHGRAV